jgi:hypothetical protein
MAEFSNMRSICLQCHGDLDIDDATRIGKCAECGLGQYITDAGWHVRLPDDDSFKPLFGPK